MGSGFLFEPEVPFTSLKNVPTWSELEQLLDNPYAVSLDPTTPGNDQGFPSYRATGITRRPGFGVTLPSLLVHPLNYNPTTGEEMRLHQPQLSRGHVQRHERARPPPGADPAVGPYQWTRTPATISSGASRVNDRRDGHRLQQSDTGRCGLSRSVRPLARIQPPGGLDPLRRRSGRTQLFRLRRRQLAGRRREHGSRLLGAGRPLHVQPHHSRFRQVGDSGILSEDSSRPAMHNWAPAGSASLRSECPRPEGHRPTRTTSLNTDPNDVTDSNENDYIRNQTVATALGKALFWDMQVGSDGVQSCGTLPLQRHRHRHAGPRTSSTRTISMATTPFCSLVIRPSSRGAWRLTTI